MPEYTTRAKIEESTSIDFSDISNEQVTEWIQAVSRYIDLYTGREAGFDAGDSDTVRYFDGNGQREIIVDNFITITNLQILAYEGGIDDVDFSLTEGKGNDYVTFPYNCTPKYKICLEPSSSASNFEKGKKRIKITAKWGYSEDTPADISTAATLMVTDILNRVKGKGDKVTSESLGDYSIAYENLGLEDGMINLGANVKQILDRYKLLEL